MRSGGARLVAAGIFLSRLLGLVRQRAIAQVLGAGPVADALAAAFRIPNLLQNLFGEGALSASFIPVYAKLMAEGRREDAGRVAGAVFGLLSLFVAFVTLFGVLFTPALVGVIAPGLSSEMRELTIVLVRIIFPGVGILVLSAWCLGVLNSHRRFFLSYASPVLWNAAIIAVLLWHVWQPGAMLEEIAVAVAMASVVGCVLQLAVQVPAVLRLEPNLRLRAGEAAEQVRTVLRNFWPAVSARGVVQVSAWVDTMIASLLGAGALATLAYAQTISLLPVSLFGMSIAASELPAMSEATGDEATVAAALRERLASGGRRMAFFVIPSAVAFVALGGVLASALFEGGAFSRGDAAWVWAALAGSGVGLLASTRGRLYSSALFALRDTVTPARLATVRVLVGGVLGVVAATQVPRVLGIEPQWGVGVLTAVSGMAAWGEFLLLRRAVQRRVGVVEARARETGGLWLVAAVAASAGFALTLLLPEWHPVLRGAAIVGAFGAVFLGLARVTGLDDARRA
jgi:putative peptidoglycan lipid II flippase